MADVQMKGREGQSRLSNRLIRAKSRRPTRSHLVLDFGRVPTAETVRALAERGMPVVSYVPPTGVMVAVEGEANLQGLELAGYDSLQPSDKLSRDLDLAVAEGRRGEVRAAPRNYFVVEFHADVPVEDRRALVMEAGLEPRDHADLVGTHLLVRGTVAQVERLAEWDEVSYIFPASGELATGLPLIGCMGGAAAAGQVGQQTQRVGEGWDGPGQNAAHLTYSLQGLTNRLGEELVRQELVRAMSAWSRVVQVDFQRAYNPTALKNVNILFGSRDHGDPYPFDGPGRVLAHTFYPAPPNPEPIAGDLHFDNDELWNIGTDIDVFSVALHELGHALGLGHSDVPNAVMYPYYRRTEGLTDEDIGAIRILYAAAAPDAGGAPPATPLTLNIGSPANDSTTAASAVNASGSLAGAIGTPSLAWSTERGARGTGTFTADGLGGFQWQVPNIPLSVGDNAVTVRVTDSGSRRLAVKTVRLLRITLDGAPVPPIVTAPQTPAPSPLRLTVAAPGADAVVTSNPISAFGTIAGSTGRPGVRWVSDRGFAGTAVVTAVADGTYRWEVNPLAVQAGANNITVTATDTANRTSERTFRATYNPASGPDADDWPPKVVILSPNTTFLATTQYSISVRGTAFDFGGVSLVKWDCTCGSTGVAQGTSNWTIPNISFPVGSYAITVTAVDKAGNEGSASFRVFRYEN